MLQIYVGPEQSHLGDMWALTSFILQTGLTAQVTCHSEDIAQKLRRIASLFDAKSDHVEFTVGDRKPGHFAPWSDDCSVFYGKRYLSTRRRWQARSGGRPSLICFNFGAQWMVADKVPPYVAEVASELERRHNGECIGLPVTLEAAVDRLAECDLFLSVDSGLAHVARSVGCPVAIIEHKHNVFRAFPRDACDVAVARSAAECLMLAAKAAEQSRVSGMRGLRTFLNQAARAATALVSVTPKQLTRPASKVDQSER